MAHFPLSILPDPTLAVITYLRSISAVTSIISPDHILTQIPVVPKYPYVLIQQAGGQGNWPGIENASLQVDVLAEDQGQCNLIARTIRGAIWAIANDIISISSNGMSATVTLVSGADEISPTWMPDMKVVPPLSRYTARYAVILH